jgi:N6-L-threonylcarbamoyladenine synthase
MNNKADVVIVLGIESSCDDTSCAIFRNDKRLANIVCSQKIHENYGGVVPELASRSHLQNIIPTLSVALHEADVKLSEIDVVAYTRGPGLIGSLLVGSSFAKSLSLALDKPLLEVNHMQAHILCHFIQPKNEIKKVPEFPFLCLTVSGGHTQLVKVISEMEFKILGETIDDAVGEAFDKGAKILGLPYPGGPLIDRLAKNGNPNAFVFAKPKAEGLNFSFSGLKTSLLYFIRDKQSQNPNFINEFKNDICASYQETIIQLLLEKLIVASTQTGINRVAIAGGVSANSALRKQLETVAKTRKWDLFIPEFEYCTDNAAMIAIAGYFLFRDGRYSELSFAPYARSSNI